MDVDPFSDSTRRAKRNFLAVGFFSILVGEGVVDPMAIEWMGSSAVVPSAIPIMITAVLVYFGFSAAFHIIDDYWNRILPEEAAKRQAAIVTNLTAKAKRAVDDYFTLELEGILPRKSEHGYIGPREHIESSAYNFLLNNSEVARSEFEYNLEENLAVKESRPNKFYLHGPAKSTELLIRGCVRQIEQIGMPFRKRIRRAQARKYFTFRSWRIRFEVGIPFVVSILGIYSIWNN